jgi:hypothetical protein
MTGAALIFWLGFVDEITVLIPLSKTFMASPHVTHGGVSVGIDTANFSARTERTTTTWFRPFIIDCHRSAILSSIN